MGDHIIRRTPRTDTCFLCEPVHGRARQDAQFQAEINAGRALVRRWLLGAPRFDERLLLEARAAHPWRERAMVPWADTLDLESTRDDPIYIEGAVDWLYWLLEGGSTLWPPATDDALFRLIDILKVDPWARSLSFKLDAVDIGGAFGERGFPYPPDPTHHEIVKTDDAGDPFGPARNYIFVRARLSEAIGAAGLPDHYTDVLALDLEIHLIRGSGYDPGLAWQAVGSIFRDDTDRIVILWR